MWCMPACARRNPATFLMGQKWGGPHWTDHSALWGREPDERQLVGWLHRPVAVISIVRRQKVWVKVKQQCLPGLLRRRTVCVPSGGEAGTQAAAQRAAHLGDARPPRCVRRLPVPRGPQPFPRGSAHLQGLSPGPVRLLSPSRPTVLAASLFWRPVLCLGRRLTCVHRGSETAGALWLFRVHPLLFLSAKPMSASSLKKCKGGREQNEIIAKNSIP